MFGASFTKVVPSIFQEQVSGVIRELVPTPVTSPCHLSANFPVRALRALHLSERRTEFVRGADAMQKFFNLCQEFRAFRIGAVIEC